MEVEPRRSLDELKRLERAEKDAGQAKRLRTVILAMEGWTAPAVAMAVGLSRRVCQQWVYRFNAQGLAGLEDQRGRRPTSSLSPEQEAEIRRRLEAGPTAEDGVCSLRGADVRRVLQQEFGLVRSLAGVDHLLHRLGDSYLRPRPRRRQADPEAQAQFLRDLPARLRALAAAQRLADHLAAVQPGTHEVRLRRSRGRQGVGTGAFVAQGARELNFRRKRVMTT